MILLRSMCMCDGMFSLKFVKYCHAMMCPPVFNDAPFVYGTLIVRLFMAFN